MCEHLFPLGNQFCRKLAFIHVIQPLCYCDFIHHTHTHKRAQAGIHIHTHKITYILSDVYKGPTSPNIISITYCEFMTRESVWLSNAYVGRDTLTAQSFPRFHIRFRPGSYLAVILSTIFLCYPVLLKNENY